MQGHSVASNMARFALGLMLLTLLTTNTAAAFQHQRDSQALHKRHAILYARQNETSADPPPNPTSTNPPEQTTSNPPPPPPPTDTTTPPSPPPPGQNTETTPPTNTDTTSTPDPNTSTPTNLQTTPTGTGRSTTTNTQVANPGTNTNTGTRTPLTVTGTNTRNTAKPTGTGSETDGGAPAEDTGSPAGSGNILDNKSAAAGIFSVVGIAAAALLAAIGAWAYRKHQAARRAREADDDFGFGDDGSMRELNLRDSTPLPSGMEGAGVAAAAVAAAGAPLGRSGTQSTARRGGPSSHGHESEDYYNAPRGPLQVVTARQSSFDLIPPSSLGSAYDPGNSNPFKRDSAQPGMAGRGAPAATEAYAHGYSADDYAQHYAQQDSHPQQQWQDGQRAGYEGNYNYDAGDYNPYQQQQHQAQQYSRPPYTGAASQNPFVQAEATAIARGGADTNTDSVYGGQAITTDSVYYDSAVPLPSATGTDYHSAVSHPGSVTPTQASSGGGPGASSASLAQRPGLLPTIDFDNENTATFDDAYGDDLQTPKTPQTGAALLGPLRAASPDSFYGATPRGSMLPSPRE